MRRPRLRDAVGCALLVVLAAAHARAGEVSPRAADRALGLAIRNRDVTAVRAALDAGASPNADFDGFSALMAAAQLAPFAVVDLLLERGADPRAKAAFGHTAVMSAVQAGLDRRPDDAPEPILRRLAAAGADLDARRDDGDTALHLAVAFDLPEVVRALLAVGAHPDPVGPDGRTPLLLAVTRGNLAAASLLLDAGADPDRRDTRRRTALDEATALELPEMIALITRHRGDRPLVIELDAGALLVAARDGDTDRVRAALDGGVPVDAHDPLDAQRWTALHVAAANGHVDVATLLLARGAARTRRDAGGASALGTACRAGHAAMVELLREDEVLPSIVADLRRDRPVTVRRHAAYDAGCTGDERVVVPLEATLREDPDPELAVAATQALARLGSPSTRPGLELALRSPDPLVAGTAAKALARLDPDAARAQARTLVRESGSAASVDVGRQLLAVLGDATFAARIDRWRTAAPLAVPLLLLGTLGAACLLSLRSPDASAARALAAALDAAVAAGLTATLLLAAAILSPDGRALLGLPAHAQPYAEGAALLAIVIVAVTTATAAWVAAVASFFDTPLPTWWVRALLKGLVAAALAACVLPLLGGEGPLASPLGLLHVGGQVAVLALTIGAAIVLQTSIRAFQPFGPVTRARAWALDRLGTLAFTGFALGLVVLLTTGASWAGALAAYAAAVPFGSN